MGTKVIKGILVVAIVMISTFGKACGQESDISNDNFKASTIPYALLKHANSVVRYSEIIINIKAPGKATIRVRSITTLLNDKAQGLATMAMGYNKKYDTYSGVEMGVYDDKGALLKKYHKSDMYDGSAANNATLVTDERFLALKHNVIAYPVTIEKEYEEDRDSFIDLGQWVMQLAAQCVQNSVVKVIVAPSVGFRYKALNTDITPVKETVNGTDVYTWKFHDLEPLRNIPASAPWKALPEIDLAVNNFNCYGYPGNFSSWQSFGNWIRSLNSDVCALSPQRVAEVRKMTDTIKTEKGKARFLYNYLQQSVRYVSIQLGIGGYKPYPATFVDEKKYGDCKALSNYMRALLKAVNINADYVIVGAGYKARPLDPAFPDNSFNHAILCIPFKNDTTWLECTSSTQPFGKLGPFTENRKVLLIDDGGGKLVSTPGSVENDNQLNSEANIVLDADGGAKTTIKISTLGVLRSNFLIYNAWSVDRQKQVFTRLLAMKQPSAFDINWSADNDGAKELELDLTYDKFADIQSADKLFYRPFAFDLSTYNIPAEEKRKTDFHFDYPVEKTCVTTITLPQGFEVEAMPGNATLKFTYGSYEITYAYDSALNQVTSTAKLNLTGTTIPPEKYTEMQQFFDAVTKEQHKKLVLHRKG